MVARINLVAELQGVRAGVTLLGHDPFNILPACEQEGSDGRRHAAHDVRDLMVSDDPWPAWHRRDEPQCGGTGIDGHRRLFPVLRAADFDSWSHHTSHGEMVLTATARPRCRQSTVVEVGSEVKHRAVPGDGG